MLTPLILLIVLMGTTAFIANWSDNLGKKLGKKRVSLFGLRPRQTATLLTVVSSWGIMLFTLAALLIVYAPIRRALFQYEKERQENIRLQQSTKSLRDQTRRLAQRVTDANEQLGVARDSVSNARQNLVKSQQLARSAENARKRAQSRENQALSGAKQAAGREKTARASEQRARAAAAAAKRGELASEKLASTARASLVSVRGNLTSTQQRLGQLRQRLLQTDQNFKQANLRLENEQKRLENAQKRLDVANNSYLAARNSAFKAGEDSLREQNRALEAKTQADAAKAQAEAAKVQVEEAKKEVEQLRSQQKDLQVSIEQLERFANNILQEATLLAGGDVRISINQTLAENTIPKGRSLPEIEATLRETLAAAQRSLPQALPNATLDLLKLPITTNGQETLLEGDALFTELARFIASRNEDVAVRLLATRNFSSRESVVSGRFVVIPIQTVFKAERVLAERVIDGKNSQARIFNALLKLVEDGRAVASKAGITPPQSLEEPNYFAPDTNERIFEAIQRVQDVGGAARVKMIVAADATTIDSVQVRFEVELNRKTL